MTRMPPPAGRIAFRCDASLEIGTGHMMRCLTLADMLAAEGIECHFLARAGAEATHQIITSRGHALHLLPEAEPDLYGPHPQPPAHAQWLGASWRKDGRDTARILGKIRPGWLIVDHYALDRHWEEIALTPGTRLMVLDDLADRPHVCDILLDQNLGRAAGDYDGLVPAHCQRLIGPQFALLRPEFSEQRAHSLQRRRNPKLEHILITMGGVDKDNITSQVLEVLARIALPENTRITAVMGASSPVLEAVRQTAAQMPMATTVLVSITNMAEIMASADLAIGAAGSTSWERCCLGLPTLMLVLADNQMEIAQALERSGVSVLLGNILNSNWKKNLSNQLEGITMALLSSMVSASIGLKCGEGTMSLLDKIKEDN